MSRYGFSAAFKGENIVFGAQRPGYPLKKVEEEDVRTWIDFMKRNGIRRVVCLLPQEQLEYYTLPLLEVYEKEFGRRNVLWAPIEDFHLCDEDVLRKILNFLKDADEKREKVVVHCSGGIGRTGHVLAAWLVFGRGFSIDEALKAVERAGRDPYEAVWYGNADKEDLIDILRFAKSLREKMDSRKV
ncbi:MAG: protein-tyrosine phosphatase family protein [Candidatus Asgardarchaeia archaeon]